MTTSVPRHSELFSSRWASRSSSVPPPHRLSLLCSLVTVRLWEYLASIKVTTGGISFVSLCKFKPLLAENHLLETGAIGLHSFHWTVSNIHCRLSLRHEQKDLSKKQRTVISQSYMFYIIPWLWWSYIKAQPGASWSYSQSSYLQYVTQCYPHTQTDIKTKLTGQNTTH